MRYLGNNPTTNVAQLIDRVIDVTGLANSLMVDGLFPSSASNPRPITLPEITVKGKRVDGKILIPVVEEQQAIDTINKNVEDSTKNE